MFNFSMGELLVVFVVGIIVLGPERLPKLAQKLGALIGKANQFSHKVKSEIEQQMKLEELEKNTKRAEKIEKEKRRDAGSRGQAAGRRIGR